MELNIVSFAYLFLRLAPFVLVSFFSLSSIFNQDFKGVVYLVGLLLTCFVNILVGNLVSFQRPPENERHSLCNMLSLNQGGDVSNLPLGQAVLGYTFSYLLFTIISYGYAKQNIATLIFFPLLILFDMIWNIMHTCYTPIQLIASLILAGSLGALWAYIISLTDSKNLQYFAAVNNKEVCNAPSASMFQCRVYKNGELISKNMSTPYSSNKDTDYNK